MASVPTTQIDVPYFVTLTVAGFTDFFTRAEYRHSLVECLQFCQRHKGLEIYSYVLMTNHLHMIALGRIDPLHKVLAQFKSYSAKAMLAMLHENPQESRKEWLEKRFAFLAQLSCRDAQQQFWETGNYPEEIETEWFYQQKENYIHMNPVKSGFVPSPADWLFSSACPESPLLVVPRA